MWIIWIYKFFPITCNSKYNKLKHKNYAINCGPSIFLSTKKQNSHTVTSLSHKYYHQFYILLFNFRFKTASKFKHCFSSIHFRINTTIYRTQTLIHFFFTHPLILKPPPFLFTLHFLTIIIIITVNAERRNFDIIMSKSNPKLARLPSMRERVEDTLSAHRNELVSLLSRFPLLLSFPSLSVFFYFFGWKVHD